MNYKKPANQKKVDTMGTTTVTFGFDEEDELFYLPALILFCCAIVLLILVVGLKLYLMYCANYFVPTPVLIPKAEEVQPGEENALQEMFSMSKFWSKTNVEYTRDDPNIKVESLADNASEKEHVLLCNREIMKYKTLLLGYGFFEDYEIDAAPAVFSDYLNAVTSTRNTILIFLFHLNINNSAFDIFHMTKHPLDILGTKEVLAIPYTYRLMSEATIKFIGEDVSTEVSDIECLTIASRLEKYHEKGSLFKSEQFPCLLIMLFPITREFEKHLVYHVHPAAFKHMKANYPVLTKTVKKNFQSYLPNFARLMIFCIGAVRDESDLKKLGIFMKRMSNLLRNFNLSSLAKKFENRIMKVLKNVEEMEHLKGFVNEFKFPVY